MRNYFKKNHSIRDMVRLSRNIKKFTLRKMYNKKSILVGKSISLSNYENVFFGYYDKSPFYKNDENLILVHANNARSFKRPDPKYQTDILLIDWKNDEIKKILGSTFAWNWQQGARVHWLNDNEYIYNIFDVTSNSYRSVVGNIFSDRTTLLSLPVQESHPSGLVFSISYEELNEIRPDYGYRNHRYLYKTNDNRSIWMYSFKTKKTECIVPFDTILRNTINNRIEILNPKFNHVLISPNAYYIVFLFRYNLQSKRVTDLYCTNLQTKETFLLLNDAGVSHYAWLDNLHLILTCNGINGFGYYVLNISNGFMNFIIEHPDGHPTSLNMQDIIIDTYPDKFGFRHLSILNINEKRIIKGIGSFIEPILFHGEARCDLHPSLSPSKRFVQIDTSIKHKRSIRIIDLESLEK